jgi:hypothetical protein
MIGPEDDFVRNEYGLWCPQCGEKIREWEWISCDCGYPGEVWEDD